MVLISTENLERMQHQLRQNPTSFVDGESKEIAVPQNSDNALSSNNTTQTPGTRLTRLDAEMEDVQRGGKCTERHYGDTYGLSEKREDRNIRNENENAEDNATRDASDDNETMSDDVFYDLTRTSDIPSPSHSNSNADITPKNFEISSEHNHIDRKSVV